MSRKRYVYLVYKDEERAGAYSSRVKAVHSIFKTASDASDTGSIERNGDTFIVRSPGKQPVTYRIVRMTQDEG